jgi:hypothetical protein
LWSRRLLNLRRNSWTPENILRAYVAHVLRSSEIKPTEARNCHFSSTVDTIYEFPNKTTVQKLNNWNEPWEWLLVGLWVDFHTKFVSTIFILPDFTTLYMTLILGGILIKRQ